MHFYNHSKDRLRGRIGDILRNFLFVVAVLAYLGVLVLVIQYFS
jgi:hypothetical protein